MPIDWRLLKYREELFFRYFKWRITTHDLDHSHYCKVLTRGMTNDQKAWFSLLFGMTYRTPQAYAYWWTFPEFDKINIKELEAWHIDNWKRTTYGTDARYNKGHFAKQVRSIIEWSAGYKLYKRVKLLTLDDDPKTNFEKLFASISRIYKYGRMTGWITCQCLYDTLGLNINFDNVLIRNPSCDSSMQSIWNGYCMMKGNYDRVLGEKYGGSDYLIPKQDLDLVSKDIIGYKQKAERYIGGTVDIFKWESIWCQFKRLFHSEQSKEYPGHSSGDATSRYSYYRKFWPEVDWSLFREALLSQPGIIRGQNFVSSYNRVFGDTGLLMNMHEIFPDMPDAYEALGLDPNENLVHELFIDHGCIIPKL